MQWIVVLVGALMGAALNEPHGSGFGAVCGAVLGWLGLRSLRQADEIARLRQRIDQPSAVAATEPLTAPPGRPAAERAVAAPPLPTKPPAADSVAPPQPVAQPERKRPAAVLPPLPVRRSRSDVAIDAWIAAVRGWLFGGNTIVKAGIAILFIGLAFLSKYAAEHVDVPVEFRLAGIGAVAIALLAVGWRMRLRRPGYAQVLQGGAVAVLYLTLFAAFRFYGVLGLVPVFALMVLVAALAAALAVLQDARALAVIGALGGFATPLLVSSGGGNHVALFGYYLVLDLGIAAVAWFRTWRSLNLIGFVGTYGVATAWGVLQYRPEHYASGQLFLVLYFVVFLAVLLMPGRRGHPQGAGRTAAWVNGSLLFGLPTVTFALQYGLVRDVDGGPALSALALAAIYVALAAFARRRPQLQLVFEAALAIGALFATLVIPFALDARSTAGAWALEGAGLVWLGLRQPRLLARASGYALQLLAGGAMALGALQHGAPTAVINAQCINCLLTAAGALIAGWSLHRHRAVLPRAETIAEPLLVALGSIWLVLAVHTEIDVAVPFHLATAAWLVGISAIALLCLSLWSRLAWPTVAQPALGLGPMMVLALVDGLTSAASPAVNGGWWAWPIALATHAALLWRAAPAWPAAAQRAVHVTGALVLATLGAWLGGSVTADWGDASSAWRWLGWLLVPAVLLLALPRPAAARLWPVRLDGLAYQRLAAGLLAGGALLWTLLANAVSDGSAAPLPHLPLLNPLDLGVAVALLAAWEWLRAPAGRPPELPEAAGKAALALCGFVWLNAMLVRGFHYYSGVPYVFDAWTASLAVQTGITLLWTVIALGTMWLAARRRARAPWMVGAALLVLVVAKLLLIDLSGSGTVTRIVSFIGVGGLMLLIGYVAPLPASTQPERRDVVPQP